MTTSDSSEGVGVPEAQATVKTSTDDKHGEEVLTCSHVPSTSRRATTTTIGRDKVKKMKRDTDTHDLFPLACQPNTTEYHIK